MGNQRKHRQEARETKEAIRNGATPQVGWQEKLAEAAKNGKVALVPNTPATTSVLAPAPASVETKQEPTPTSVAAPAKTVAKPQPSVYRRPVWMIYRDYFCWGCGAAYKHNDQHKCELDLKRGLEGKSQQYPLPVGFIPGPLVILEFLTLDEKVHYQIIDATSDIQQTVEGLNEEILAPVPQRKPIKEMPVWLSQAIGIQLSLIESICGEPTPWNLGAVGKFRREGINPGTLRLGFSQFQYPGYEAKPFGCCLVPELGTGGLKGFRLTKVYNPGRLPGVPTEGTLLSLEFLNGQGPIQKLLNTWVGMEDNFQWYVKNPDKPKPFVKPEPNQRR